MEKAIASSAVAIIAQIVAIDSVTAEQGIFVIDFVDVNVNIDADVPFELSSLYYRY